MADEADEDALPCPTCGGTGWNWYPSIEDQGMVRVRCGDCGRCGFCGDSGLEWADYWSSDAEPCRAGCTGIFGPHQAASSGSNKQAPQ